MTCDMKPTTGMCSENEHAAVFPIYYFIVIVVCFYNIWTRSSTLPERHMRNQKLGKSKGRHVHPR